MGMISTMIGHGRFHFRVAGVWIDESHVLLQGDEREDFWALPGGRVEMMEPAEETLRREMREELALGDGLRIGRLLWINQNFFHSPAWGGDQHELGLYFLMAPGLSDAERLRDKRRDHPCAEPDTTLRFRWFRCPPSLPEASSAPPSSAPPCSISLLSRASSPTTGEADGAG